MVSILALATLPGDRALFDPPITHSDFSSSTGYIRRIVNGTVCHAVDWDGTKGVDTILRENGRRSGPLWHEFREWRRISEKSNLIDHGNKACELLLKHFGPYHEVTSQALTHQRNLARERASLAKLLDKEYPPAVRLAAREYSAPHFAYTLTFASPLNYVATPILSTVGDLSTPSTPKGAEAPIDPGVYSRSEHVLRDYLETNGPLKTINSLDEATKIILEKIKPLEEKLELLDIQLALSTLPSIPGEAHPTDLDLLEYGSLICRHRAVLVGLLLADAGFEVEIVEGVVSRGEHSGRHLFVYTQACGILEPSADGPDFWQKTIPGDTRETLGVLIVEGGAKYHFHHRTLLSR